MSPETRLLVRVLRYQGRIDEDQLREVVRAQQENGRPLIGELRDRQLVDQQWADDIELKIRRKARSISDAARQREADRSFGQLALGRGWVDVGALEEAILEQQRLRRVNLRFRIGEIMVRRGQLTVDQVREILSDQGVRLWSCVGCEAVVNQQLEDGERASCPLCSSELHPAAFLESVRSDVPVQA